MTPDRRGISTCRDVGFHLISHVTKPLDVKVFESDALHLSKSLTLEYKVVPASDKLYRAFKETRGVLEVLHQGNEKIKAL